MDCMESVHGASICRNTRGEGATEGFVVATATNQKKKGGATELKVHVQQYVFSCMFGCAAVHFSAWPVSWRWWCGEV